MWQLCLDDSVFGGQPNTSNLPFENLGPRNQGRPEANSAANRIEANLRPRKGLSAQSHQICIDNFTEVINYNYPVAWFSYIQESIRRLKANLQGVTMQILTRKMLLGAQFPMLDMPRRPESLCNLEGSLKDEAFVSSLPQEL